MDIENSDPTLDLAQQPDPPHKKRPWPWLVGGLAFGLIIGVAVAGYLAAARDFFRAPGWGWAATETLAQMVLMPRSSGGLNPLPEVDDAPAVPGPVG